MDIMNLAIVITSKRKALGLTQQRMAEELGISYQAVSKWENGMALPDISLLPSIAKMLGTTVDALLGYSSEILTDYEERYRSTDYYWGLQPNRLCFEIMKLMPPICPYRILDIGCGEGKDSVFLAKNGYLVSGLDITDGGLEKARQLASKSGVHVDFFKANIDDFHPEKMYDIIFSSGVFHFLAPERRGEFFNQLKEHTNKGGLNVLNTFVNKPFLKRKPDYEKNKGRRSEWKSGELFTLYHEWKFEACYEEVFDCNSGGVPHEHCMDSLIARKL